MLKFLQTSNKSRIRRLALPGAGLVLAGGLLLGSNSLGLLSARAHQPQSTVARALSHTAASTTTHTLPAPALGPSLIPVSPATVSPALQQQGIARLQAFQQQIALMQQFGGAVSLYQQQYSSDQQALTSAQTDANYQAALTALNGHVSAIQIPALKTEALSLQQQLEQRATAWSSQHIYFDSYDGKTYNLGYEYQAVAQYPTQNLLDSAKSVADYQCIVGQLQGWLADFAAYTTNFTDPTPYNQIHTTDLQRMQQEGATTGQTIVVSLAEQAMRVYQDGKLVNAFQIVTGMPGHASLPGNWWIESKLTNTTFTSGKQPGQQGYYPPTPIALAMQYHSAGYFIHQSWWRSQYGPNNQFPHLDSAGTSFAYEGSHGCINMSTTDVTWLYAFAQVNSTRVLVY